MPLVTSIPVVIFAVGACIASYIGIKTVLQERQKGNSIFWYQQFYILMGATAFLLAVFFLLIGLHDIVPEHNLNVKILIYIIAGIVLVVAIISCGYMLRHYPFPHQKNKL